MKQVEIYLFRSTFHINAKKKKQASKQTKVGWLVQHQSIFLNVSLDHIRCSLKTTRVEMSLGSSIRLSILEFTVN